MQDGKVKISKYLWLYKKKRTRKFEIRSVYVPEKLKTVCMYITFTKKITTKSKLSKENSYEELMHFEIFRINLYLQDTGTFLGCFFYRIYIEILVYLLLPVCFLADNAKMLHLLNNLGYRWVIILPLGSYCSLRSTK